MPSTAAPEVELTHDILNLVERLRPHVSHLSGKKSGRIKVQFYAHIVRRTTYLDIDNRFRVTRYGIVPTRAGWRTVKPVKRETLSRIPIMQLVDMRRALIELLRQMSGDSITGG
jgi:hypothetical protein